ncbi:hypothetical protein ABEQ47_12635, partial [Cutibacterium acnes]
EVLAGWPNLSWANELERRMHNAKKDQNDPGLAIRNLPPSHYRGWLWSRYAGKQQTVDDKFCTEVPRSPRWHLQQYGTEFRREHMGTPNYWLDKGLVQVLNGLGDPSVDVVVVTDMRLPNEYAELANAGAKLVRIVRNWHIPEVDTVPYHQSDIALMAHAFDALVVNEWGKPEAMYDQIKEFL